MPTQLIDTNDIFSPLGNNLASPFLPGGVPVPNINQPFKFTTADVTTHLQPDENPFISNGTVTGTGITITAPSNFSPSANLPNDNLGGLPATGTTGLGAFGAGDATATVNGGVPSSVDGDFTGGGEFTSPSSLLGNTNPAATTTAGAGAFWDWLATVTGDYLTKFGLIILGIVLIGGAAIVMARKPIMQTIQAAKAVA